MHLDASWYSDEVRNRMDRYLNVATRLEYLEMCNVVAMCKLSWMNEKRWTWYLHCKWFFTLVSLRGKHFFREGATKLPRPFESTIRFVVNFPLVPRRKRRIASVNSTCCFIILFRPPVELWVGKYFFVGKRNIHCSFALGVIFHSCFS